MIKELFEAIDAKNPEKFVSFLSNECSFRFGNFDPVVGSEEINNFVTSFFASIESLSHDIKDSWPIPNGLICHGFVSYVRKDGSSLTVPFANVFKFSNAGIIEYLVFADTSALYQ